MSSTLIAPELEIFPNRYCWTLAECYEMAEEGYITGRYEIIDGEVIGKTGENPPHTVAINLFQQWLLTFFNVMHIQPKLQSRYQILMEYIVNQNPMLL